MRQLGISVYAGHAPIAENKAYLDLAAKHGFTRVFMCLLSIEGDKEKIVAEFKETVAHAMALKYDVIVDVAPRIFSALGISYQDLSFFADLGVKGFRLDMGFTGMEESMMTYNPHGLQVEINMSNDTHYIETIMDYKPNTHMMLGCHNFYPHRYSGLTRAHFDSCNVRFKQFGLTTAAFVNSHVATFGPWPVDQGLCTLEEHRALPIDVQARDLFFSGIDVVIISNCFASEAELATLAAINKDVLELKIETLIDLPAVEKSILFDELHFNRGDVSSFLVRSTQSRVKHKGHHFAVMNAKPTIERGDIIIESSEYGHYAGEMQIARHAMENSGKSSVVARVHPDYIPFLDRIEAWHKFKLIP
ncbi:DUF871 domain-containing protein [Entomospira culicis]|uniref:DUF871 domain-containing protein n=1 Tax=Entomospira culicis TaxID=2719989 RepID=A0A968L067_9SPIO|nr:MupG family TIM beta-alpha barrel fold protein [Entomospira culicis]NIZ19812.1 DUF871 domain-containing protein [Entomospira culicis]NIZ70026.1 DUF871 domain-containing protein [Entomospira culicis]WDI37132.1 MupG family TIM beta-alpha barrel fold protein [Entomospira culicis]WDI38761.1 MupG family TIM beta-alpha barrel fold protein [Entomospira culicis]